MFNLSVTLRGVALLCAFSGAVFAADGPEVVGFGGGVTYSGGGGTHYRVGGGGSFRIVENVRLLGEISYSPLLAGSASVGGVSAGVTSHVLNFGGGADYSFGDSASKLRPYAVAVVGAEHLTANVSVSGAGSSPVSGSGSLNAVYLGAGGGLRYSIGKNWGIKPEVRYQHSVNSGNSIIFTLGGFFRVGD